MNIGTYTRSAHDSRVVGVDFSAEADFTATPVTSATVAGTGLTLSAASVAANVVSFRVSGGTAGTTVTVTVTATNGTDTMCVSLAVETLAC